MSIALTPFLYLPFKEQTYEVTSGWHYSKEESKVHGIIGHGGMDFKLKRGTPVFAAASGIAISSYFVRMLKEKSDKPKLYQGKPVGMGLGFFVQIYHPEVNLFTVYGHLERVAPSIKFHKPKKLGKNFWPVGHKIPSGKLQEYEFATEIRRGDLLGFVGDSGLTWGYEDYPQRPDPDFFPSWDETHLHFEVFIRTGSKGIKKYFDPYGIKGETPDYPDSVSSGKVKMGENSPILWVLDSKFLPKRLN